MSQGLLFGEDWRARLNELLAQAGTGPLHTESVEIREPGAHVSYRVTAAVKSEVVALLLEYAPELLVEVVESVERSAA